MLSPDSEETRTPKAVAEAKVWLHLSSEESINSKGSNGRRRPQSLKSLDRLHSDVTPSEGMAFAFISPVEPLARFSQSLNRVYIPLDTERELEVGVHGLRSSGDVSSSFALMGTPGSSLIGTGAFGSVYKALHFPTMRRVAIKKIPKDFGGAFDFVNSFARELRSLYVNLGNLEEAQRQHRTPAADDAESDMSGGHCSYLVTLYDAYIERYPICLCLVLEYMEGGSCEALLTNGGPCGDESLLRSIAYNSLKGLEHLHGRKRLHHDVKPANILLTAERFAKLADFGLSPVLTSGDPVLQTPQLVGTVRYWPPEMWGPEKHVDPLGRGDVWSLGMSLLALVNGAQPLTDLTSRLQMEIELCDIWNQAHDKSLCVCQLAQERGVIDKARLREDLFSGDFVDFMNMCLVPLSSRPTAAQLLEHQFLKGFMQPEDHRRAELKASAAALRTHIAIHKEWQVTWRMIHCLAREIGIEPGELGEYLTHELDVTIRDDEAGGPGEASEMSDASVSPTLVEKTPCLEEVLLANYDELDRLRSRARRQDERIRELEIRLEQQGKELVEVRSELKKRREEG